MSSTPPAPSRRWSILLASVIATLTLSTSNTQAAPVNSPQWIVELDTSSVDISVTDAQQGVFQWYQNRGLPNPEAKAGPISIGSSFNALSMQSAGGAEAIASLANVANVRSVVPTVEWEVFGVQANAPTGLDRIDGTLDGTFNFPDNAQGAGIDVFVIDSGLDVNHQEFVDVPRRKILPRLAHETTAGTIAGATFGVAKQANLFGFKVLNAEGRGSTAFILQALQEASCQVQQRGNPAVVNMSLGNPRIGDDGAVAERAIEALIQQGVAVVVAARNSALDACDFTPAFIPSAITVAATDPRNNQIASFSNVGSCIDIAAPGVETLSVLANSQNGAELRSGTSMATPHVAGVMASLMSTGLSANAARQTMLQAAERGVIGGNLRGTVNLFLSFGNDATDGGGGNGDGKKVVADGAGKEGAKKGAKKGKKKSAKKVAKEGAKEVAKEGANVGAEEGAKKGKKKKKVAKKGANVGAKEVAKKGETEVAKLGANVGAEGAKKGKKKKKKVAKKGAKQGKKLAGAEMQVADPCRAA